METPAHKNLLASKLAKILGEIGKVEKTGHNAFHKYDYVTENDLVYAVRDKLSAAGIFVFTSTESQTHEVIESTNDRGDIKKSILTTVTTLHTFIDGESGDTFSVKSQGQGSDNGDKGGYKAITGAMKYFLYKCFMIPTGDDPEGDEKTDARHAAGPASSSKTSAPAGATQTRTEDKKPTGEVPRDIPASVKDKFRDNKWTTVKIHFGKQKGTPLGKLETESLTWWIQNWQPKPFKDKLDPTDVDLRAALDVADEEWK